MLKKLFLLFVLSLSTLCFAQSIPTYMQDKAAIIVNQKQPVFIIKLKSNPTTGFTWFLRQYDHQIIETVSHRFEAPNKKLVGASGFEYWTFKMKPSSFSVPQTTQLRFVYMRPWETQGQSTVVVFKVSTQ